MTTSWYIFFLKGLPSISITSSESENYDFPEGCILCKLWAAPTFILTSQAATLFLPLLILRPLCSYLPPTTTRSAQMPSDEWGESSWWRDRATRGEPAKGLNFLQLRPLGPSPILSLLASPGALALSLAPQRSNSQALSFAFGCMRLIASLNASLNRQQNLKQKIWSQWALIKYLICT